MFYKQEANMRKASLAALMAAVALCAAPAGAGVLSKSTAKITQLRIVHSGPSSQLGGMVQSGGAGLAGKTPGVDSAAQPGAWGVFSDYIGPGDINRLLGVEVYLDTYHRIAAVKVSRESYNGDVVTSLFTDIVELSIQTLQPGSTRPSKDTPITIRTADGLTFP